MIRECERCGSFFDLLARDPYLPELHNYLCFSCEHVESANPRAIQRTDKKRRSEAATARP
jgi:hypothetical protein